MLTTKNDAPSYIYTPTYTELWGEKKSNVTKNYLILFFHSHLTFVAISVGIV